MNKKYAIIVAGGKGMRMGTDIPKQFLPINGKPILMHTIEAFYKYDPGIQLLLVLPSDQKTYWRHLCKQYDFTIKHKMVEGGETRFHSVQNGLSEVKEESLIAVHDGVRPLVTVDLIARLFDAAKTKRAAYPVIPVVDTLRRIVASSSKIMDRSRFCLVQTPQVFTSKLLIHAYQSDYSEKFTDDATVVEYRRLCKPVMVEGSKENIKITTPIDLIIAEAILQKR